MYVIYNRGIREVKLCEKDGSVLSKTCGTERWCKIKDGLVQMGEGPYKDPKLFKSSLPHPQFSQPISLSFIF